MHRAGESAIAFSRNHFSRAAESSVVTSMTYGAYSCYRDPSSGSLSGIDDAFAWIISLAHPVRGEETVSLALSHGRVTAHDIIAASPLPRFDHAAMDGFGLSDGDLGRPAPFDL